MESRIIKFRAWDTKRKKWVTDYLICPLYGNANTMNGNMKYNAVHETELVLVQFTGLKDKNGKEIYEGDVVRKESYSPNYRLPIVWRDCMFQLGHTGISPLYDEKNFEIVGNIYENPELVK